MSREQLKVMVAVTSILLVVVSLLALVGIMQSESYKQATYDNCKQYEVVPEQHLDRVPDGCVPQYFEAKNNATH